MTTEQRRNAYQCHQLLLGEAGKYPQVWRLLVGLGVVSVVVVALNAVLFAVVANSGPQDWASDLLTGSTPLALLIVLSSFVFATIGVALAVRLLQHRSLVSILGERSLAIRQFWRVLCGLLLLGIVLLVLPPYDFGAPLVSNLPLFKWLILLPVSLFAVLIQTSAEELLFRGYMQQSLAARFRSPLVWMGLPSLLFAAGHYSPVMAGDNAPLVAIWALVFGLLTADLTARAGTLGPAIALHFFNNISALLIISLPENLGGLALYHFPYETTDTEALTPWLVVDFALMIVGWLTARLVLRR